MINESRILEIIKEKGPIIPAQLAREINTNILFASAMLSELVSKKIINISHIKIGGSPLYYVKGQEEKLQNFTSYLHEKEKKAYEFLKEKKVLRDSSLEPVMRVALRNIKDFAKALNVKTTQGIEIFWKWYLLSNEEAEKIIKAMLEKKHKELKKEERKEKPTAKPLATKQDFLSYLLDYFNKNNISIIEKKILRKNKDIEFIVKLESVVGKLEYYCRAKNKKRVSDSDLASALVQGQAKKLPVLFLITGELTKKAKEMLGKEIKGVKVVKV